MSYLFAGRWSRKIFAGCGVFGLAMSAVGIAVGTLWTLAVGVPLLVVGLYGLLVGRQRLDPYL